jgi:hypothetical protein
MSSNGKIEFLWFMFQMYNILNKMEEINPELFLALPLEMQERIISQSHDLIRIFAQVNHEYESLLEHQYFKNFATKPLILKELNQYIANKEQPITGHLFINPGKSYLLNIIQTDLLNLCIDLKSVLIESDENIINIQRIPPNLVYQFKHSHPRSYLDLLSIYNIVNNRLKCVRINPKHAQHYTLSILNNYRNPEFDIIELYSYLIMNKYVFNIKDNSKISKLEDLNQNMDEIRKDIKYLLREIENRIMSL